MAHAIAHVIEYRAHAMNAAVWNAFKAGLPRADEDKLIAAAEQAAGFRHGWFFDAMADACFQNDGAILKAASYKAPAKGVRGNIANGAADVGIYGAAYRR